MNIALFSHRLLIKLSKVDMFLSELMKVGQLE